jgi:hypothetical protein
MIRTKIGKSSRLFISILVIQDLIESIGNPILLKGDEVLLNGLLAQVLSDIAPKPSATFSIQICPKSKLQLGPTDSFYPEPPSSFDIATARNPNSSVSPIRISFPPRWPCQLSVTCCNYFGLTEICNRSHQDGLPILYCLIASLRSHRVDAIGATETRFALRPSTSVPPSCSSRSHRDS